MSLDHINKLDIVCLFPVAQQFVGIVQMGYYTGKTSVCLVILFKKTLQGQNEEKSSDFDLIKKNIFYIAEGFIRFFPITGTVYSIAILCDHFSFQNETKERKWPNREGVHLHNFISQFEPIKKKLEEVLTNPNVDPKQVEIAARKLFDAIQENVIPENGKGCSLWKQSSYDLVKRADALLMQKGHLTLHKRIEVYEALLKIAKNDRPVSKYYFCGLRTIKNKTKNYLYYSNINQSLAFFQLKGNKQNIADVRVDKNGHIQVANFPPYASMDEFKKELSITSLPDEVHRLAFQKLFSHFWGLKGIVKVDDTLYLRKEGNEITNSLHKLTDLIRKVKVYEPYNKNIFNDKEVKEQNKQILVTVLADIFHNDGFPTQKKVEESFKNDQIVLIPSGSNKHSTFISYYKGTLAITNKGIRNERNKPGTYYFKVDPMKMKKFIKNENNFSKLIGNCTKEEFISFQPSEWSKGHFTGTMVDELDLKFIGFDKKSDQKVGNCSVSNLMASIHVLATFQSIDKTPLNEDESIVDRANELYFDYKAFSLAIRTKIFEEGAEFFGGEEISFDEDLYQAAKKMYWKEKKYPRRKMYSARKEEIKSICTYYSEKIKTAIENNQKLKQNLSKKHSFTKLFHFF